MKKLTHKNQIGGSYGGCMASGLKFGFLVALVVCICMVLFSCASTKEGCGTENYKHRFNK